MGKREENKRNKRKDWTKKELNCNMTIFQKKKKKHEFKDTQKQNSFQDAQTRFTSYWFEFFLQDQ